LPRIVAIVEGHGEVEAVPILLRRIAEDAAPGQCLDVPRPIRVRRQRFVKEGELERAVELAARQTAATDGILILLDAEADCPRELAEKILRRAVKTRPDRRIKVVFPKRMYEAWFLAAAASIAGRRDLDASMVPPPDPEGVANPKAWLTDRMPADRSYRETLDQAALTASFDLRAACSAPSFRKLCRDLQSLL
jgi:hypothetical protein